MSKSKQNAANHPPSAGTKHLADQRRTTRVVVLGASGFLGGAMVHAAANAGYPVVAASRSGVGAFPHDNVEMRRVDLYDLASMESLFRPGDVVYHFAAATYTQANLNAPATEYTESLQPLLDLINVAADAGIAKMIYPSSGGTVYAGSSDPRSEESHLDPITPYAIFKIASEHFLKNASREGKFATDIYRIANPYGPGQRRKPGQGVLPHWIHSIRTNQPLVVYGDGSMARDYLYVDDATSLMLTSIDRLDQSDCLNLGSGVMTSLAELIAALREATQADFSVEHKAPRCNDVGQIVLSMQQMKKLVGPLEFTPIDQGLRRMWQLA